MSRLISLCLAIAVAAIVTAIPGSADAPQSAGRIVAVGDIHGASDAFANILGTAGLIDGQRRWRGGTAVLVQTGDILDRGTAVRDALDLLMRLENEARDAGGRVVVLLGNHEVMNLLGDVRDVNPETFARFADDRSADRQRRAYEDSARAAARLKTAPVPRDEWLKTHPPGWLEYVDAFSPRGRYGRWLRQRPAAVRIGETGFMHAGLSPATAAPLGDIAKEITAAIGAWDQAKALLVQAGVALPFDTLRETVDAAAADLERIAAAIKNDAPQAGHVTRDYVDKVQALLAIGKSPLLAADGPMWFRGFATWPDGDPGPLEEVLARTGVRRFVTGHTPMSAGRVGVRFDRRVFLIDTGMLTSAYPSGRAAALELNGARVVAIYEDRRETLVEGQALVSATGAEARSAYR